MICGCSSTPTEGNGHKFFDFHEFFMREITEFNTSNALLIKRSSIDDNVHCDTLTEVDWNKELYAFTEIEIKEVAWQTDFKQVDDEHDVNEHGLVFHTTNERQRYREIKFDTTDGGEIYRFAIVMNDDSKLSPSTTMLSYTKGVGYTIKVDRDTRVLGSESFQIVGHIKSNE